MAAPVRTLLAPAGIGALPVLVVGGGLFGELLTFTSDRETDMNAESSFLYDIDRIVSRTLGYAVVTVLLAGTYIGIVTLAGTVIPDRYGSIGVAAATLAVAALFVLVRRAIRPGSTATVWLVASPE